MKVLLLGLGIGAAIQAWRNFPADGPVTATSTMLLSVLAVIVAYAAGRGRRLPTFAVATATATAEASAVASNNVQVAVVVPGQGARPGGGVAIPDESTGWIGAAHRRPELSELDGMDLSELVEDYDGMRASDESVDR